MPRGRFNGAENNCTIARNLGILQMNSNCFVIYFQQHSSYVCSDIYTSTTSKNTSDGLKSHMSTRGSRSQSLLGNTSDRRKSRTSIISKKYRRGVEVSRVSSMSQLHQRGGSVLKSDHNFT